MTLRNEFSDLCRLLAGEDYNLLPILRYWQAGDFYALWLAKLKASERK